MPTHGKLPRPAHHPRPASYTRSLGYRAVAFTKTRKTHEQDAHKVNRAHHHVNALTLAARQYEIDAVHASELALHGMTIFEPAEALARQLRQYSTDARELRDKITFLWEHVQP
jgi:hypothetical protein